MPYVKRNGVGVYEEPNPSEMMIKLYDSGIKLVTSDLDKSCNKDEQIKKYERYIEEEKDGRV